MSSGSVGQKTTRQVPKHYMAYSTVISQNNRLGSAFGHASSGMTLTTMPGSRIPAKTGGDGVTGSKDCELSSSPTVDDSVSSTNDSNELDNGINKTFTVISDVLSSAESSHHRNSGTYNGDRSSLLSRHRDDPLNPTVNTGFSDQIAFSDTSSSAVESPNTHKVSIIPNPLMDGHHDEKHMPLGRSRSKSFNEAGEEVIRQLAPPISIPLVGFCLAWYSTSAMSNTLNKTILMHFPYPVTLSMVQFVLAASFGAATLLAAQNFWAFYRTLPRGLVTSAGLRYPTREILIATAPMGAFQLAGHIFSHMSTQLIPLSLVHTIKALSPLFTVAAYRFVFRVTYSPSTYLSLVPLTIGVIMTCAADFDAHFVGFLYALVATLIFVSQNMFSKKLLTTGTSDPDSTKNRTKLDKLNILCYCSSLAFIFTFPLWLFSEGFTIFSDYWAASGAFFGEHPEHHGMTKLEDYTGFQLLCLFLANGAVHFIQTLLAFQVLGMVSPVTYSVASLIKRIVVITVAIFWFGQTVSGIQGWGILLTFLGLYLYDRCGGDKHKRDPSDKPNLPI